MDTLQLPSNILLYVAGATAITGILVNGIRTAIALPALVAFLGACVLGCVVVVLFMVANGELMTPALWAGSVIAGVMVGGAAAGSNAVHSRSKATEPPMEATPPIDQEALADAVVVRIRREMDGPPMPPEPERIRTISGRG